MRVTVYARFTVTKRALVQAKNLPPNMHDLAVAALRALIRDLPDVDSRTPDTALTLDENGVYTIDWTGEVRPWE